MYVKVYISLHTSNQLINYKLFPHSMPWAIECTHSTVSPIESIHSTAEPLNVYIQQFAHWIYTFNGLTRWMYTFNSYLHSIQHIYDCYIWKIMTVFCYSYVTYYCLCFYYHFAVVLLAMKALIFFALISFENSIKNNSIYLDLIVIFALAE